MDRLTACRREKKREREREADRHGERDDYIVDWHLME